MLARPLRGWSTHPSLLLAGPKALQTSGLFEDRGNLIHATPGSRDHRREMRYARRARQSAMWRAVSGRSQSRCMTRHSDVLRQWASAQLYFPLLFQIRN